MPSDLARAPSGVDIRRQRGLRAASSSSTLALCNARPRPARRRCGTLFCKRQATRRMTCPTRIPARTSGCDPSFRASAPRRSPAGRGPDRRRSCARYRLRGHPSRPTDPSSRSCGKSGTIQMQLRLAVTSGPRSLLDQIMRPRGPQAPRRAVDTSPHVAVPKPHARTLRRIESASLPSAWLDESQALFAQRLATCARD